MANEIKIYDAGWLEDTERRVRVARGFLTRKRIGDAAEKAGFYAQYSANGELMVKSLHGLGALFDNLKPAFPNTHSRPINADEYERYAAWAEQNDSEFYQSTQRDFEVVRLGKGFGIVYSAYPDTNIEAVTENNINNDFAYRIREVFDLR